VPIVTEYDGLIKISRNPYYESVDLICTSPPFALVRKKEYGNVDADDYVDWFKIFAGEFYRKERVGLN
jgi:site-specific DNA-methyltransferase (cytosine-N4-specific)